MNQQERGALVSIVVRTMGDRPAMLREALASIVKQGHPDVEIVLVLDRPDGDPTRQRFQRWIDEIVGWKLESHRAPYLPPVDFTPVYSGQANRSAAANAGVLAASGTFVGFLDDDDVLRNWFAERLATTLQDHPGAAVAYGDAAIVECDPENRPKPVSVLGAPRRAYASPFTHQQLLEENRRPINAYLVRRKALIEGRVRFDPELQVLEDWDVLLKLSERFQFVHAPGIVSEYRIRDDLSNTSTRDRELVVLKTAELRKRYAG